MELPQLNGTRAVFSLLLLDVAVLSKILGCGLGAGLCGFDTAECLQVGTGMACRGELALIVANWGLSMGALSQAMVTPIIIIITVVGYVVLMPILLKLCFDGQPKAVADGSTFTDR